MIDWRPFVAFGIAGAVLLIFVLVFGVFQGQVESIAASGKLPLANETTSVMSNISSSIWTGLGILGIVLIIIPIVYLLMYVTGVFQSVSKGT